MERIGKIAGWILAVVTGLFALGVRGGRLLNRLDSIDRRLEVIEKNCPGCVRKEEKS